MDNSSTPDTWYNSSKATLRPLVAFSEADFELESNLLCGRYIQFAADCTAEKEHKGFSRQSIAAACEKVLVTSLICKTKIVCPVQTHDFLYKCQTKRGNSFSDPGCQQAIESLSQCASRMNIPSWWLTPTVRPANREDLDTVTTRNLGAYQR